MKTRFLALTAFALTFAFLPCVTPSLSAASFFSNLGKLPADWYRPFLPPPLNAKVLHYAESKLGQQVDRGECWDLANEALAAAGARQPGQGGYSTYTFGTLYTLSSIRPGDILQFENVNFKHTSADGSWYTNSFPHHTAIVRTVSGDKIEVLQQNVNGDRHVQTGTIILSDRQPGGSLRLYRPHAR